MSREERRSEYLETGEGPGPGDGRLDLIRAVLGESATWAEPPPHILEGLLAEVGVHGAADSTAEPRSPRWPGLVAAIGVAAATVALMVSTVSVFADRDQTVVALSGTDLLPEAVGVVTLRPTGSGWWIRLDVEGLPPAPEDSYYEGWVWNQEGDGVAIGTFHQRGGDEPVVLWAGVDLGVYRTISVTLEPEADGPEPSGHTVLRGTIGD